MSEPSSEVSGARVFVSGVASASHLVPVAACVRSVLDAAGDAPVTVVDLGVVRFLGVQRVSEEQLTAALPDDPRLRVVHARTPGDRVARPQEALVYVAVGAPGIKPWLRLVAANRRRPRCLVVDEGLGTYGGWRTRWAAGRREGRGALAGLRAPVRALAVTASATLLTDERWALHAPGPDGWRTDPRLAAEYRRLLPPSTGRSGAPVAVLLSQPWVRLGLLSAERYAEALREVERVCASAGLALLVRPHPVEDPADLAGLPLQQSALPAELDRRVVDASVVLGWNSTALVNVVALHGTRALRLTLPELDPVERTMSSRQRSLLAAFVPGPLTLPALAARLRADDPSGPAGCSG